MVEPVFGFSRAEAVPARGFAGSFGWPMQLAVAMVIWGLTRGPVALALSRQGGRH